MSLIKNPKKLILQATLIAGLITNGVGYTGAYLLTHYRSQDEFGLGSSRPENKGNPSDLGLEYKTERISVNKNEWLEAWLIPARNSQGTVILFHGKDRSKSSLLEPAKFFNSLDYNTVLVDFRGVGNSSGNRTTVGVTEGKDVATIVQYIRQLNYQKPLILYGVSMGSGAILRAIAKENIAPDAIILELPFTRLLSAVKNRLKIDGMPSFIFGELVVFWGGVQNNFNGFQHNPVEYAKTVHCPTLILHGDRDALVSVQEVEELSTNLNVPKKLVVFPNAKHELLITENQQLWQQTVVEFLKLKE